MYNYDVSVIMPVYKTKNMLERAVKSVINQTYENWELIIVDDCSPDDSGEFADTLAKLDGRIKVIHKPQNEGLSMARNTGLDAAKGEYVLFFDSDDWIEPDTLNAAYTVAANNKSDVVVFGYYQDTNGENNETVPGITVIPHEKKTASKKETIAHAAELDREKVLAFAWNKLYNREFLIKNSLRFENRKLIEDILFNVSVFEYVQNMCVIPQAFYHYMKYSWQTLSSAYIPEYFDIINYRYERVKALYEKGGIYDGEIRSMCSNVHLKHIATVFERSCSPKSGKNFSKRKEEAKEVLNHPYTKEALQYKKASTKQEKLINAVIGTKSPFICALFGQSIYFAKDKMTSVFDKIK